MRGEVGFTPKPQCHLLPPGLLSVSPLHLSRHWHGFPGEETPLVSWPSLRKTQYKNTTFIAPTRLSTYRLKPMQKMLSKMKMHLYLWSCIASARLICHTSYCLHFYTYNDQLCLMLHIPAPDLSLGCSSSPPLLVSLSQQPLTLSTSPWSEFSPF